jgi:hypothetical protein
MPDLSAPTPEHQRLQDANQKTARWKFWGAYLSERQWGTVREDYSASGDAWNYFTHDQSRSRAYRWGEDGLAGFSDEHSRLCLGLALWNGQDSILKERLFGLTNGEGNHGEDVKELYYYLDATPTHSYLKMLYKYPQRAFPYDRLVAENRRRGKNDPEFELFDTGLFNDDRYFDVFVEYAKAAPDDILLKITVENRGPQEAPLHVLPQIWFRNTWSWMEGNDQKPELAADGRLAITIQHRRLGDYTLSIENADELLFTDNETNRAHAFGEAAVPGYFKDAFHEYLIEGRKRAVNPAKQGTKAAACWKMSVPGGGSRIVRLRLSQQPLPDSFADFEQVVDLRRREADEFYGDLQRDIFEPDERLVQRQALAGMIWSQQYYFYDIPKWLDGDPGQPSPPASRLHGRNCDWMQLNNADIISMPDKWEYPWYAAWDLAFHCLPLVMVDAEFAKNQLLLLTRDWYMHPNGQLPAYEWNFSDVNPPVHAWAAWRVFQIDRRQQAGRGDLAFLENVFHRLLLNFTWWVNRKDPSGRNMFQGGFLGLDNIGIFDRSAPIPQGGSISQADATSWMAMYCLNMMRIALELALSNPVYEDMASKFFEHFLYIAKAMTQIGGDGHGVGLWDDVDQFYYDELNLSDGRMIPLRVRSMIGLIPLFAVETLEPEMLERLPAFNRRLKWFLKNRPELAALVSRWEEPGRGERRLLSLLRGSRMKRLFKRMLDESEFLSPHGIRALSRRHLKEPYVFNCSGQTFTVSYLPGESDSGMFGGNSNWRGPVWFPVNFLIIESLQKFHHYYGDDFRIECPSGTGVLRSIDQVAGDLSHRLARLFLRDALGRRAVFGQSEKLQNDPHFRDYIPFYEYFHGDTGRGLGASHQTGWTGLIAKLLQPRRTKSYAST